MDSGEPDEPAVDPARMRTSGKRRVIAGSAVAAGGLVIGILGITLLRRSERDLNCNSTQCWGDVPSAVKVVGGGAITVGSLGLIAGALFLTSGIKRLRSGKADTPKTAHLTLGAGPRSIAASWSF